MAIFVGHLLDSVFYCYKHKMHHRSFCALISQGKKGTEDQSPRMVLRVKKHGGKMMKTMNSIKGKIALAIMLLSVMVMLIPALPANASNGDQQQQQQQQQTVTTAPDFQNITAPVEQLIRKITGPLLGIVGALGSVFCIILGVKCAKAEEPQDREKAKTHLKNAIIGFVLIFVLLLVLNRAIGPLSQWVTANSSGSGL